MSVIYSSGVNPVSTTLSSSPSAGGTSFTITSASGLATVPTGSFGAARIQAEGANTAEDIIFTRSTTTITLANSTTLASAHASGATIDFDVISSAFLDQLKQDALSGGPHGSNITGAGALTLGIMNFVNITSASVTLTIADGTFDGQLVGIQMLDTCTKLATLDPAGSTKIDNAATRIMWAGEVAWLAWDLANTMWRKVAGRSIPMIGEIYLASSTTSSANNANTLIALDTAGDDNTGLMVNTAGSKLVIQRPGDYQLSSNGIWLMGLNAGSNCQIDVFKNGVAGTQVISTAHSVGISSLATLCPNKRVPLVATDYVVLVFYQNSGLTTPTIVGGRAQCFLTATEVPSW